MKKCWICEKEATRKFQSYTKKLPTHYCDSCFNKYIIKVDSEISKQTKEGKQ